ncbi:hypothetical protein EV426DRAFT_715442 [Tirmania nivea]|nr:hypothetical protein EV426DRAFT_715442 [Tirmania nivea]
MSTEHSMEEATGATTEHAAMEGVAEKGKGKAIQEHTEGEEDSSDDDDYVDDGVDPDEDDLLEIDASNIIQGGRTRGKNIDWAAVNDEDAMDDDDPSDDEYKAPVEETDTMKD